MATPVLIQKRILFVDDDASFLNMVEKVFGKWSNGNWQFLRAPDAGKALAIIDQQLIDVIVVELNLAGLDGLQLLNLLQRRFANIPKAILTAKPTDEGKAAALKAGAELYLEKPATIEAMELAFHALDELAKWRPANGFLGMMWCANLHEVLQVECLNQSSAVLEIISGTTRGKVYVKDGAILHAHADHHKGTMALAYLLTFKGGQFYLRPFTAPPEVTIDGPWEALLMEAAQTRDQEGTAFFKRPVKKDLENWEKTGIPPMELEKKSDDTRLVEEVLMPRTEELLVCSSSNDVLLQWQCGQPEARIDFMNYLQEKALQLARSFGAFDRLEIKGDDFHVVARVKNDSRMFFRLHRPPQISG